MGCNVPNCARPFYAKGLCGTHYQMARRYPDATPAELGARSERAARPRNDDEMRADILARVVHVLRVPDLGECHEWTGAKDNYGYGNIRWGAGKGRLWGAHRLAFHLFVHPVEPNMDVCHRCDNPPCIRREHLFYGTHRQNLHDARDKGRMSGNGGMSGERNGRATLSAADVAAIRSSTDTSTALAQRYGVSLAHLSGVRTGRLRRNG